ncbi:hypothetical protein KIPB_002079 [Kipferlia bialata]|uniref:Uncharacterized protein n=1 Tax=Kipferlia bialata TaxID=797122 RepID=A0A9K3GEN5_9EUKA|nr:hypothetical protein KIPB_002079 [Kipferlia bialata]|eukprot:g2079.t1
MATPDSLMVADFLYYYKWCLQDTPTRMAGVAAIECGVLQYLPLGFRALMQKLHTATSITSVASLVGDIQAFCQWYERLTPEEREQTVNCRRPEMEDVMPSLLAVEHSVFGALQLLILKGLIVVACVGSGMATSVTRCDNGYETQLSIVCDSSAVSILTLQKKG